MAEQFRTPWLSDVVDILKRDSTNRIMVGNKEFVLIVRCKDCKFGELDGTKYFCRIDGGIWCDGDWFCANGERREDNA